VACSSADHNIGVASAAHVRLRNKIKFYLTFCLLPVANAAEKSRAILIVQKRDAFLYPVFDGV
jgi:hypothetical protein